MIHATAIVDPAARIGANVSIGAYSVIGAGVEIGEGTTIGPHVVIEGMTRIGRDNRIFQFASIGAIPQDKKFGGEKSALVIGDRNFIREFVTLNRGTGEGGGATRIGNDNWIMAYVHVAHDCTVGNHTVFSNNATLAGHVTVGDYAILSGFAGIHQFCRIGAHAFVGMGCLVNGDVPPFVMVAADYGRLELAGAVKLVRDIVNTPAEDMGPAELSQAVREQAEAFGGKFREWVGDELLAANFPAIHAVGRAASRAPRLMEIRWGDPKDPRLAIVGKGVCFDSGGLDLKTHEGMRLMKKDLGGAAHALALARLVMQRKLPYSLHLLIPAVENAVSGNAYRPGDIVATRKGLKVEIGNTDAEGRVILCDALAYAVEEKPRTVIDFATLTGAARVALGPELPVLFSNDEELAARLEASAAAVDDPIWRLPLWRNYRRLFDSDVADFSNSGRGGFAGSIVAALFLDYFIPREVAWAHFDVYAWNDANRPGRPVGGEAQGLRAVLAALQQA